MTREQAKQNLIGFGIENPTDEQISNYLNQINGETQKEKDKNDKLKEKADKYDETQKLLEEEQNKNLTETEKLQKALDEAKKAEQDYTKKSNRLEVEKILVGSGLTSEDYKDLIEGIVSDNLETSKTLATSLTTMLTKQKESAIQKTKEELMDGTRTPGADGAGTGEEGKTEDVKFAEEISKTFVQATDSSKSAFEDYQN